MVLKEVNQTNYKTPNGPLADDSALLHYSIKLIKIKPNKKLIKEINKC